MPPMTPYKYLVIRIRKILGYRYYFGPIYSCEMEKQADAERLYGMPDHDIVVVAWSMATKAQKEAAAKNPENR